MNHKGIEIAQVGNDTVYIKLPTQSSTFAKTIRIEELIAGYEGPMVNLDFNTDGQLIGVEIIVFGIGSEEVDDQLD